MSPQLEVVLMVSAAVAAISVALVSWSIWHWNRNDGHWTTVNERLVARLDSHDERIVGVAERVTHLERATGTPTGPRLGVAPSSTAVRGGFPSEALSEALRASRGEGAR